MTKVEGTNVVNAIRQVLGEGRQHVPLHEPVFGDLELRYVSDCLKSTFVSSVGQYVGEFEKRIAEYTGARRAVAVVNGTAALQVALMAVGVQAQDEVLVPSLTFVATANAVSFCGATPHFVDSELRTLGMNPHKLGQYLHQVAEVRHDGCYNVKTGRCIRAVVPMHTFGHPVDLEALMDVCDRFNLQLVEDAAESLGSFYKGRHTGTFGRASVLSFNGNKIVTTGGGGAVLTNDEDLADRVKHLTTTAKAPHRWAYIHDEVGFNYRLPNLNAALGCAQMDSLEEFVERKRRIAERYREAFTSVPGIRVFREPEFARSNYWLNAILLEEPDVFARDKILEMTHDHGIGTRPAWTLLHRLPMYRDCPRMDLSVAEDIEARLINLPSGVGI